MKRLLTPLTLLILAAPASAAVQTTTIAGKVLMPNGAVATSGAIIAALSFPGSINDLSTNEGERVAGRYTGSISGAGAVSLVLVPNDDIIPAGTYYNVTFNVSTPARVSWTEKWSVTTSPDPIDVGNVARLDAAPGLSLPQNTEYKGFGFYASTEQSTITDRYYAAGMDTAAAPSPVSIAGATLYALPLLISRGWTIDRLAFSVSTGCSVFQAKGHMAIYSNTADGNPYPAAKLVEGSEFRVDEIATNASTVSYAAARGSLVWLVFGHGCTDSPQLQGIALSATYPMFGYPATLGSPSVGLSVAQAYSSTFPATFPAGASVYSSNVPLLAVRFAQ